jgi:hypothetical protein
VAQVVEQPASQVQNPEFKPQCCQKKKEKKKNQGQPVLHSKFLASLSYLVRLSQKDKTNKANKNKTKQKNPIAMT